MDYNPGMGETYTFNRLDDLHPVGAKLGRGSRAEVKLVKHQRDNRLMALKSIDLSECPHYANERDTILMECELHKRCKHPNIIM